MPSITRTIDCMLQHLRTLAWVGHHLRNPAHVIASAAALIKDSLPRNSKTKEDVETIRRSSDDINRILSDVTNYAALQEGKLEVRPSVWEIRGAIRQLIATHRGTARVPVTIEIAHDVPRVSISDPLRVQQILSIGLANAVQSTPTGYIHLRVFISTQSLEHICNDADGHASITIAPDSATRENNSGRNTGTSARNSPRTSPRPSPPPPLSPRPSQEPSPPLADDTLSVPIPSSLTDSSFSGNLIFQIADTGSGWQHTADMLVQAFGTGIGADGTVTPTSSRIRSPNTRTSTIDSISKYTHDAPPSGHRGTS
jgi:signal transduction histidine kinase